MSISKLAPLRNTATQSIPQKSPKDLLVVAEKQSFGARKKKKKKLKTHDNITESGKQT